MLNSSARARSWAVALPGSGSGEIFRDNATSSDIQSTRLRNARYTPREEDEDDGTVMVRVCECGYDNMIGLQRERERENWTRRHQQQKPNSKPPCLTPTTLGAVRPCGEKESMPFCHAFALPTSFRHRALGRTGNVCSSAEGKRRLDRPERKEQRGGTWIREGNGRQKRRGAGKRYPPPPCLIVFLFYSARERARGFRPF